MQVQRRRFANLVTAKYEFKSFIDKSAQAAALLGPSRSAPRKSSPVPTRSQTAPVASTSTPLPSVPPPVPAKTPTIDYSSSAEISSGISAASSSQTPNPAFPMAQQQGIFAASQIQPQLGGLTSLQHSAVNSTLPLQYLSPRPLPSVQHTQPVIIPGATESNFLTASNPYASLSGGSPSMFPSSPGQPTGISPGTNLGLAYGTGISPNINTPGMNAFPTSHSPFGAPAPMYTPTAAPLQSPFSPQPLQSGMIGGLSNQPSPQPFIPYSSTQHGHIPLHGCPGYPGSGPVPKLEPCEYPCCPNGIFGWNPGDAN